MVFSNPSFCFLFEYSINSTQMPQRKGTEKKKEIEKEMEKESQLEEEKMKKEREREREKKWKRTGGEIHQGNWIFHLLRLFLNKRSAMRH